MSDVRWSAVERRILAANGGRPFADAGDLLSVRDARASYRVARRVIGLADAVGSWATTDESNVKLGKSGVATVGTTFSPGDEPVRVIDALRGGWRPIVTGRRITPDVDALDALLARAGVNAARHTVCPRSTAGCRAGCVITTAGKGPTDAVVLGRVARWLTLVTDPAAAVTLMRASIVATVKSGREQHRVRFGVADDVRWELVAPVLFAPVKVGRRNVPVKAYAYTKWSPEQRDGAGLLQLTYSATGEHGRWSAESIAAAVAAGHNVAAALAVTRGHALPDEWHGARVIDGDVSDDRYSDPRGVLVALRAKGRAVRDTSGFVFAV